jgi:ABC-type oligopeptide transport system substrate-binding subunit
MRGKSNFLKLMLPLLVLVAMLVTACGGSTPANPSTSRAPDDKQVLRYPMGPDDAGTIDPALAQDTLENTILQATYTSLIQFKEDGSLYPQLAASLPTVSSDGLTYSFTLRPGLKFSNGDPLTADDVAFTLNRVIVKETKSPVAGYLSLLKNFSKVHSGAMKTAIGDSIVVKDATHIDLVIESKAAYFLQTLTYVTSSVVNKKIVEKYGDQWTEHSGEGAGAGPFKIESYNHTVGITMVPNPNYYDKQPGIKKLQFLISGTTETGYKSFLSGQYDLTAIPSANLEEAKQRKDYHTAGQLTISYLTMNYNAAPFGDLNVRKAFALAIDKDAIISSIYKNAHVATNHVVPEGMLGYVKDLKGPDGTTNTKSNVEAAKAALTASTFSSASSMPPIKLTYITGSASADNRAAAMQQMWKTNLGVDVKLEGITRAKMTELLGQTKGNSGPVQMFLDGWVADYPDPQDWLSVFFAEGSDYNNQNYGQNNSPSAAAQQAVQKDLAQADIEQDQTKRLALYAKSEQTIIGEHVGWVPMYQARSHQLRNPKLQGWSLNPLGVEDWPNIFFTN